MSTEVGKIEVGDEYDFRGTVVALADDGWPVVAFRDGAPTGGACRAVSPEMFVHATLVKRAERPLKVGDMVVHPHYGTPKKLVFIMHSEAILDEGAALSDPLPLADLTRAPADWRDMA